MSASVIIDIVLGVLALLIILKFTIRGFIGSLLDTAKVFLAVVLAYLIRIPVAKLFDMWFMRDSMVSWVKESLVESLEGNESFINFIDLYKSVPGFYNNVLANFGLGDVSALGTMETASYEQIDALAYDIGSAISMMLSTVLAVIVLFIIFLIVLTILARMMEGLLRFSSLVVADKILGAVLGATLALGFTCLVSWILEFLVSVTGGFGGGLPKSELQESMLLGLANLIF